MKGLGLVAVAVLGAVVAPRSARADKFDDAHRRLIDLEERTRVLASEFKDAPPKDPNAAERRMVDAELLFTLKNYDEAATILLDVIERYPNSHSYDDAMVLLGESLYQSPRHDYTAARTYFEMAVQKNTGSRKEQQALQRLVEIALRLDDFDKVQGYLSRLEKIPPDQLEPSVPYVRGKYLYMTGKLDEAAVMFGNVPAQNEYYLQSRYFMGTIQVAKGDLAAASSTFDSLLRIQPRNDTDKEVQDLARLAVGRLYYERNQFDKAAEAYESIQKQSKYYAEARDEATWNYIKAKDFVRAYRSLDLALLQDPDSPKAPERQILRGNLHLRLANFFLASESFADTREKFEPIYKQLLDTQNRTKADPTYFEALVGKGMDKLFDISVFIPADAVKWIRGEPDVARMMALADDVGGLQRDIKESEALMVRLERAVSSSGKVGIFSDLATNRTKTTEVLNQIVDIRRKFVGQIRSLIAGSLSGQDKAALDQIGVERASLEQQLQDLPMSAQALRDREKNAKVALADLDAQASQFNVQIQSMDAELVAIEQYFIRSKGDQKIRPEDLKQPVGDIRGAIDGMRAQLEKVRNDIVEATREFGAAGAAASSERVATVRLTDLMKREQDIYSRARSQLSGGDQRELDKIYSVLQRADAVHGALMAFDARLDAAADRRLGEIREKLSREKTELEVVNSKLGGVLSESQTVGGGLAQAMLGRVTDRFYELVVQSEVGEVDVAWGLKDAKSTTLSKLINQQKMERKAVEDDFRSLLEEDK
jgi:tetratricopeptide (TPR) repeat protein